MLCARWCAVQAQRVCRKLGKNLAVHPELVPENNDVWELKVMTNFSHCMTREPPAAPKDSIRLRPIVPIWNAVEDDNMDDSSSETQHYDPQP